MSIKEIISGVFIMIILVSIWMTFCKQFDLHPLLKIIGAFSIGWLSVSIAIKLER